MAAPYLFSVTLRDRWPSAKNRLARDYNLVVYNRRQSTTRALHESFAYQDRTSEYVLVDTVKHHAVEVGLADAADEDRLPAGLFDLCNASGTWPLLTVGSD